MRLIERVREIIDRERMMMDEWMDGWMDRWMDGWMNESKERIERGTCDRTGSIYIYISICMVESKSKSKSKRGKDGVDGLD